MQSQAEKTLEDWLFRLRRDAGAIEDRLRPYEYTTQGQVSIGKEISKRHIKMTIFGNVLQLSICYFLAFFMFPARSFPIMLFSIYLGAIYSWYVLGKRRFKRKWDAIERLEEEAVQWKNDLKNNKEYLEQMEPIIDQHRKLFAMNNYHSIKDLLVNQNTNTDDGKHFFLTKNALDTQVFSQDATISHIELVLAMNDIARKRIVLADKEAWTQNSTGSANLVASPASDEFLIALDQTVSRLIESVAWITDTAPELKRDKEDTESDITDNVVSLFAFKNTKGSEAAPSPHQESFVELSRLAGILADIIEPILTRYRLTTVDLDSERAYLAQMTSRVNEFNAMAESAYARAHSISGASVS